MNYFYFILKDLAFQTPNALCLPLLVMRTRGALPESISCQICALVFIFYWLFLVFFGAAVDRIE
jgi:hypothetical protein